MKLTLSENIRTFRKERGMTQEKLAEALGVTVGAVHKWEAGLSQPELNMLVEIADFFDTSVDILLGYRLKDNRITSLLDRIADLLSAHDPAALTEIEKALVRYPNSFEIVYAGGKAMLAFGAEDWEPSRLRRALELLERSILLLSQNTDPHISEATVVGDMATAYFLLGEYEKSIELLKKHNANGVYSSELGIYLSVFMGRCEEAVPFLSDSLLEGAIYMISAVLGYFFLYCKRKDWDSALAATRLGIDLLSELKRAGSPGFLDKAYAELLSLSAYAHEQSGNSEDSEQALRLAAKMAKEFDPNPDYSLKTVRFIESNDKAAVFDILGRTAAESVTKLLSMLNAHEQLKQWEELINEQ